MAKQTVSGLQIGHEGLLASVTLSTEDILAELARTPGTRVRYIGEQGTLFSGDHVRLVEVWNGKTRISVNAELAARFGFAITE